MEGVKKMKDSRGTDETLGGKIRKKVGNGKKVFGK